MQAVGCPIDELTHDRQAALKLIANLGVGIAASFVEPTGNVAVCGSSLHSIVEHYPDHF